MEFNIDHKLYVRVDSKIGEKSLTNQDYQDHLAYVENIAGERYLLGGGFLNADGGMLLFEAENLEDAQRVAFGDPIITKGYYRCDVFEWVLKILSANIGANSEKQE